MSETWKPIVGFDGLYSVSDQGRVRRDAIGSRNVIAGRVLAGAIKNNGYVQVTLYRHQKPFGRLVHRLVAEAFLGACPAGAVVNHKDGNKTNNIATNLEYETNEGNLKHAREMLGKHQRGERCKTAKLTAAEVRAIRNSKGTQKEIAKRFGVSQRTVWSILRGESWIHA